MADELKKEIRSLTIFTQGGMYASLWWAWSVFGGVKIGPSDIPVLPPIIAITTIIVALWICVIVCMAFSDGKEANSPGE